MKKVSPEIIPNAPVKIDMFMKMKPKYIDAEYHASEKLKNKTIMITSGANGIAKALALAFAKEGANIILIYSHQKYESALSKLLRQIEKLGCKGWIIKACTFDEFKCKKMFEKALKIVKNIDILINLFSVNNKREMDEAHYLLKNDETLKIQSLFTLGRLAPTYINENGGIIHACTISSYASPEQILFYSALKASIKEYTREMHVMFSKYKKKLRVSAVTTGTIWSNYLPDFLYKNDSMDSKELLVHPMHPYEVVPVFVFLAARGSEPLSGETLNTEGKYYKL